MIIGNGLLAKSFEKKFKTDQNIIIFASGVSNSKEKDSDNFEREKNLLQSTINHHTNKILVYFSTCTIEDLSQSSSLYIAHKKKMEQIVQNKCENYFIFRLPQVVGKSKSPTLVNFLIHAIKNNKQFEVQKNASRNLICVDDILIIATKIIEKRLYKNEITNIASPLNLPVIKIVEIIESIIEKKANYILIDYGFKQSINIDKIKSLNIKIFHEQYIEEILYKRIKL